MKVIVLGAGVIGVTSAWYLAQAGHEVRVIDRQPSAGMETSFANGGQVSAGHAEPWARPQILPKVLKWLGREDAPLRLRLGADPARWRWALGFVRECAPGRFERNCRALAGLSAYSLECLQELRRSEALEYDALARGILQFCTDERDFEALARHAEQSRAYGMVREVKSATECLEVEPALRHSTLPIVGGVLTPGDESGDAHRFTQELARRCREEGVSFLFDTDVEGAVADVHALLGIRARNDTMKADAYVAALGSYSPLFLRTLGIRIPVYPLKGYSITVPLDERDRAPSVSLTDEAAKVVIS
ncbi:MAG: FAD-dependent oxidoreductase, partial [Betaproteobacteria bacterium]|nr:FAD-dependent oxidoreductase [Betaproteobacteria bacterium]